MIDTPVVFICFNRLELIKITFSEIAKQKPKKLYIIMDGPRSSVSTDKKKTLNIKKFIKKSINWDCNVFEIYSKKNLGLKERIISGLNEVFKENKNAIVLEDDCLPHSDFFFFCQSILKKYEKNDRIKFITGNNFQK
jgi:GT2 family glycosyltransferase